MSEEQTKQFEVTQWIGTAIQVGTIIVGIAVAAGFVQARVTGLEQRVTDQKTEISEIRNELIRAMDENTRELRSLNSRISKLEGKLEK